MKKALTKLANRFGFYSKEQVSASRAFNMGQVNRLTADWISTPSDANREIRADVRLMRQRAREMERNDDYISAHFEDTEDNVLGADGIGLEMKITDPSGKYDVRANKIIEDSWKKWGRKEFCSISQEYSWLDLQKLTLRSTVRDGAILHQKGMTGLFGFAIEPIEIDQLDTEWTMPIQDGEIRLGVEYGRDGKRRAYWIFERHPGSLLYGGVTAAQRRRIEAAYILHVYRGTRVSQATGHPWINACATRVKNLSGYEEAAVIDARISAAKSIWLERTTPTEYQGLQAPDGERQMEISPGSIEELPVGMKPFTFAPNNPNADAPGFIKSQLRGIAKGLGRSYNTFANDLESVNYSSARVGLLDERERWKKIQRWFIDVFVQPVFEEWLRNGLMLGAITDGIIKLPPEKFDKFNKPEWKPRRWDWVDPLKDTQANVLAIEKGLTSRRRVIADSGGDIEDIFLEQEEDKKLEEEHGLQFVASDNFEAKGEVDAQGGKPANEASAKPKGSNG